MSALALLAVAPAVAGWVTPPSLPLLHARPALSAAPPTLGASRALAAPVMMAPATELIAAAAAANAIPSALVAYGHYFSFILATACVTAERLTIKPGMTMEEEKIMTVADSLLGVASLLIVGTGYLRVTQYGKGWEFYQHE
jgi:hypothetical protein